MARLGKQDWLNAGLDELSENGYEGIKIDRLCKRLDISIGSFYHHFVNIDDYAEKLIEAWESLMHQHLVDALEQDASPEERLRTFHDRVLDFPVRLEVVVRAWSFHNDHVTKIVEKMDKKRMRMIAAQFMELGHKSDDAKLLAEVEYAAYLGVQMLCANKSKQSARKLYGVFSGLLRGRRDKLAQMLPA
jgi:AcrR family transcriptional regulator